MNLVELLKSSFDQFVILCSQNIFENKSYE